MSNQNNLVCISTYDGFTHRLLSTTFRVTDVGEVLFTTKYYPGGEFKGALQLPARFAESWLELLCHEELATLSNEYDGQWEDLGGAHIELSMTKSTKCIKITEVYDRRSLKTAVEKKFFALLDEVYGLQEQLYCYLCNTDNPKKSTVSYEELTKTQTQWDLEEIQNTPVESFTKKRRKQLKKAGLIPKQGHNG